VAITYFTSDEKAVADLRAKLFVMYLNNNAIGGAARRIHGAEQATCDKDDFISE
jgi:hypothetical protein